MLFSRKLRVGRFQFRPGFALAAVLLIAPVAGGCTAFDRLRGEPFPQNDMAELARSYRGSETAGQCSTFSNKARQIEQSLGAK